MRSIPSQGSLSEPISPFNGKESFTNKLGKKRNNGSFIDPYNNMRMTQFPERKTKRKLTIQKGKFSTRDET